MKKEKKFEIPELKIIDFCSEDIITSSKDAGDVDAEEIFG